MVVFIMGVSGAGKSTIGRRLGQRLGWEFRDGDEFHPAANVEKMRSGKPLDDDDRRPWLDAIHARAKQAVDGGESLIVACSALKDAYRRRLSEGVPGARFVHLRGSRDLIAGRLAQRGGHFMPATLLDSQFDALEEPEGAIAVDVAESPETVVDTIVRELGIGVQPAAQTAR